MQTLQKKYLNAPNQMQEKPEVKNEKIKKVKMDNLLNNQLLKRSLPTEH